MTLKISNSLEKHTYVIEIQEKWETFYRTPQDDIKSLMAIVAISTILSCPHIDASFEDLKDYISISDKGPIRSVGNWPEKSHVASEMPAYVC